MNEWGSSSYVNLDTKTDDDRRRYDESVGKEVSAEDADFKQSLREEVEKLKGKGLPECGETRLWMDKSQEGKEVKDREHPEFKMMSWNIERGYKVKEQIEYLRSVNPDVLCLQEVDWDCGRTGGENIALHMAQELGYKYVAFTTEFMEVDNDEKFPNSKRGTSKRIGKGGGVHGQAVLSRFPLESVGSVKLNKLFYDWEGGKSPAAEAEPRVGQRVAQKITIKIGDRNLVIYNAHLEDKEGGELGRLSQWDDITRDAESVEEPVVIMGDFNTLSHGVANLLPGNRGDYWTKWLKGAGRTAGEMWQETEFSDSATRAKLEKNIPPEYRRSKKYTSPHAAKDATFNIGPVYSGKLDWTAFEQNKFEVLKQEVGPTGLSDHRSLLVEVKVS